MDCYSYSSHCIALNALTGYLQVKIISSEGVVSSYDLNGEAIKISQEGTNFCLEESSMPSNPSVFNLGEYKFVWTEDGGILIIDIRDAKEENNPPVASFPLGTSGSYLIVAVEDDDDLLVYYYAG